MKITTNLKAGLRITPWSFTLVTWQALTPFGFFSFFG